jgi:hypothetical protein
MSLSLSLSAQINCVHGHSDISLKPQHPLFEPQGGYKLCSPFETLETLTDSGMPVQGTPEREASCPLSTAGTRMSRWAAAVVREAPQLTARDANHLPLRHEV